VRPRSWNDKVCRPVSEDELDGVAMLHYGLIVVSTALLASTSASFAGPCLPEIGRTQVVVDDFLKARAAVGPRAPESARARLHRQPTPSSIAAAEEALGALDASMFDIAVRAMASARESELRGDYDYEACKQALRDVEHSIFTIAPCGRSICR
jgi:hypothetical protein